MRPALIFLSYRRNDTAPFALALRAELELRLDGNPVFLDLDRLHGGEMWADVLNDALAKASVLIALIGESWLGRSDQSNRIDDPEDWVRREVGRALSHPSQAILPVLVGEARLPPVDTLPADLRALRDIQALRLLPGDWNAGIGKICDALRDRFQVSVKDHNEILPKPNKLKTVEEPISNESLERTRRLGMLPDWQIEIVHDVNGTGYIREFLRKKFICSNRSDAFEFVRRLGEVSRKLNHDPVIEIKFKTVTIRLSTFDAGHSITTFDRRMAVEIDKVFQHRREDAA